MVGRGSFIESFPLFGYDLNDYDALFSEKLDLLMKINQHEVVSWKGKMRPPIDHLCFTRSGKVLPMISCRRHPDKIRGRQTQLAYGSGNYRWQCSERLCLVNIYKDAAVQLGNRDCIIATGHQHPCMWQPSQQA